MIYTQLFIRIICLKEHKFKLVHIFINQGHG